MKARAVPPEPRLLALLPAPTFADAYRVAGSAGLDARRASQAIFAVQPGWAMALMRIRNGVVRPLGLKTEAGQRDMTKLGRIGLFPVLAESPQEVLMGLDDRHLDFRVAVSLQADGAGSQVTVTTVVQTNNRLGRFYLAVILPFHRLIVGSMLSRAARCWSGCCA